MNELPTRATELAVAVTSSPTAKSAINKVGSGPPADDGTCSSYANEQSDETDISLKDFLSLLSYVYQGDGEPDPSADVIATLMRKLTDFLQEGIIDAVLPYVAPRVVDGCPGPLNGHQRPPPPPTVQTPQSKSDGRRRSRSTVTASAAQQDNKPDFEVEIHVCDEVKNAKKDFRCPQKLLVSKMGYFAEVTVGQKLEDMDISVHCDLAIFDWLMRWVKKDLLPKDAAPTLDVSNAVPILVSAAFLRMGPLLDDCLQFCQANLNAILRSSTNLGCLNDNILSRLASLCSNTEVDNLKDKKDRIQSRLFCKLIASLSEPRPDNKRGHYASLSAVYRCQRCKQLVPMYTGTPEQADVPCRPDCSRLDGTDGKVYGMHVRDPSWNLTDYVRELRVELQSWRRTYWRLWADCHFQVCSMCGHLYPARLRRFCRYHVQPPQFFGVNSQRGATHSIGRYSCCGQRAFRFEPIDSQSGCSFRSHQPVIRSPADEEVEKVIQAHNNLICLEPSEAPPVITVSSVNTSGETGARKDSIWWEGLEFAPARGRHGLLGRIWESYRKRAFRAAGLQGPPAEDPVSGTTPTPTAGPSSSIGSDPTGMTAATSTHSVDIQSSPSTSSSEDNQDLASSGSSDEEESAPVRAKPSSRPSIGGSRRRRGFGRRASLAALSIRSGKDCGSLVSPPDSLFYWSEKVSTRNNQDNQRECEERAIRFMVSLLTRRTSAHHSCNQNRRHGGRHYSICNHSSHCCGHTSRMAHHMSNPAGGSYLRIEAAWREEQSAVNAANAANAANAGANVTANAGSRPHQNTSRPRSKAGR